MPIVKIGEMGASSMIICCCLLLILLDPSVHCYNVKILKPEDKGIAEIDEEEQQLKFFTGRKFIFGNEFGRRRKWDSFRTEEELGIVLWRRLLEDKEESTVNKEADEQHNESHESSQNNTLPEDPKKETAPMSKLMNPTGVKLEVKDVNVEGLKAMEKNTTENIEVNDVQKQLNDGTENDKGEWKSTGELTDGIKENIQAGTTPGTSTEARKQEIQSTEKESALDLAEKGIQEMKSNQAEMQTNSAEFKTETGPQEMENHQAEMQTISTEDKTEIGPQEMESNQAEMQTKSTEVKTEIGLQKIESNGDEMQTNSSEAETDIKMQKIENTGVELEMQTNSVHNKTGIEPQKTESNGDEMQTNSTEAETYIRMQKIENTTGEFEMQKTESSEGEMQVHSVDNKTETGMQKIEDHEAETLKISKEIQGARTEGDANSTDTGLKEFESLTDSKGTEAQNAINIELQEQAEPMTNSKVSMNPDLKSTVNSMDDETKSTGNLESATKSRENKLEEAESFTNSTSIQTNNTEITEAETLANSEEAELEKSSESTKADPLESSSQTETKEAVSLATEILNNSTDTEMKSEIDAEKPKNSEEEGERKSEEEGGKDSEEEEDLVQEFRELPWKLHDTAEKVADHLMPGIQKLSNKSKIYFNMASEEIAQGFQPLVGRHYAPFMATTVSCLFLLIPLFVTVIVLDQIRAFLPLQKLLFLTNIYLANYFATLMFASFILAVEPMEFFYRNSPEGYIYLQLLQGLGYVLFLSLQCCNVVGSTANGSILDKLGAGIQLLGTVCIGLHYYVTVFHRAMAHKPPRTCWRVYAAYVLVFSVLSFLSRLRRGKKEYVHAGAHGNTHKKN
ncbi:hypothetical protein SUGI_1161720 [Cryptomeria japonica]|uniref:uncharacterized protein LOC131073620 n=1 Tax=Cryptomeria japonica TaxID=3369 RepID=UPI00241486F1|nr:uncharacterized protein LOC131073620 [Cryptomeria japonica]GLJ54187.1 hypothetical protein SUGI_1161720 [Cryptomeria japonica]